MKHGVSQEALYLSVPFDTWKIHLQAFIEKGSEQKMLLLERDLMTIKTVENIRYDYFFARVAEAKVLYHADEQEFEKKKAYLLNYASKACGYLRKIYQPQVLKEAPELLPEFGQAALLIEEAFEKEAIDSAEMLRTLKRIVDVYPTFKGIVRGYIMAYGVEQKEKARR